MANERTWSAVAPQLLTADGGQLGQVQVADTAGFRVKAYAILSAPNLPDLQIQIKRVESKTKIYVGLTTTPIQNHAIDISAYTVASGARISQPEQAKSKIVIDDKLHSTYETDPVVAWRTLSVDQYGNPYTTDNPMPLAFDGTIAVGNVEVVGPDGVPLRPNRDGSLNVVVNSGTSTNGKVISKYAVAAAVPSGVTTTITSYTCPPNKYAALQIVSASGDNIGKYTLLLNGTPMDSQRTNFGGDLNARFDFVTGNTSELVFNVGDVISIQILHNRPYAGDFEARIQILEVDLN
jgi:hypothetical protein